MREILFRGKRLDNGKWVYGYYHGGNGYSITKPCIYSVVKNDIPMTYEVLPESVGQYTGLTDKNGKKIFEGDIVRYYDDARLWVPAESGWALEGNPHIEERTVVVWCEEISGYAIFENMPIINLPAESEVIGNIHDNPELFEVQE